MMPPTSMTRLGGVDAHQALVADRAARGVVDDGEIVADRSSRALTSMLAAKFVESRERPVEQIGPHGFARRVAVRAFIERLGVRGRVEGYERDPPPFERDPLRPLGGMRVDRRADGQGRRTLTSCRISSCVSDEAASTTKCCPLQASARLNVSSRKILAFEQQRCAVSLRAGVG